MTLRLEFRDTVSLPNGTHLVFIVSIMNQKWREGNKIPPQRLRGQGVFEDARFTNGHFLGVSGLDLSSHHFLPLLKNEENRHQT